MDKKNARLDNLPHASGFKYVFEHMYVHQKIERGRDASIEKNLHAFEAPDETLIPLHPPKHSVVALRYLSENRGLDED